MLTPIFLFAAALAASSPPNRSLIAAVPTDARDAFCDEVRKLATPRMVYSDMDESDDPLKLRNQPDAVAPPACNTDESPYCISSPAFNTLQFFGPTGGAIELSVPDMAHRLLTARWVNPKLAYLEMWFNPHFGAYWLFDAERQRIVYKQLQNDGINEWFYCRKDPPP